MEHKLLEKALEIAVKTHKGQTDKVGCAYIFHPIRVAERCLTEEEKIVALLHDTIEDTSVTAEYLIEQGFSHTIVDAVIGITRQKDETYEDFIIRTNLNPISRQVKIHDLEDNMDIRRLNKITEKDTIRLNKYLKAYKYLLKEK